MTNSLTALALQLVAIAAVALAACGAPRRSRAEPTSTTAVERGRFVPASIPLYAARHELAGSCADDLSSAIEFEQQSTIVRASSGVEVEKWAICMRRPELARAVVVLLGTHDAGAPEDLFFERAWRLREALSLRGVDTGRVLVGKPQRSPEASGASAPNVIRLELVPPAETAALRGR